MHKFQVIEKNSNILFYIAHMIDLRRVRVKGPLQLLNEILKDMLKKSDLSLVLCVVFLNKFNS